MKTRHTAKGKILIIDDLPYDVKALKMILEHAGYDVISAVTGTCGISMARKEEPDGILLDIQLPDTDGFEICRQLKEDPATLNIPVVFLTAHYQDEASLIRGLNLGANDFIFKPCNTAELLARVGVMVRIRKAEDNLRRLSLTDELTGLGNRRHLLTRLEEEFERCRRSGFYLSCLMLDIDHFKMFNDTYGHDIGDQVLELLADLLRSQTRKSDVLSRYGGEEFVGLLPVRWPEEGIQVAERIRKAAEEFDFSTRMELNETLRVTVSIGVSECLPSENHNTAAQELVTRADEALYQAKSQGRNRTVHWSEDGSPSARDQDLERASG